MPVIRPIKHALRYHQSLCRTLNRPFSSSARLCDHVEPSIATTRNIGIIAHIDAGKTTTTERMLYYSGFTRRLGDVDDGSTVTDFLPAERARGITIQSAAITFRWPPIAESNEPSKDSPRTLASSRAHNINLIDTPGHADFTFEVLRSLRILDGAVCILDGVAGVEAQTEQVWAQASHYQIPRILFVNKLDREGAAFSRTVKEVGTRLNCWPAVCQIPWWSKNDSGLQGVGDITNLSALLYTKGSDGKAVKVFNLESLRSEDPEFAEQVRQARVALVELLSEYDDGMVEKYLDYEEDHLAIPQVDIVESLRRVTLQSPQRVAPVLAGAAFRNVGVQPLLDAVVNLLPSPEERPDPEVKIGPETVGLNQLLAGEVTLQAPTTSTRIKGKAVSSSKANLNLENLEACALAFKVVTDPRRGVLVYLRVYSGAINRTALLFNTNLGVSERCPRLFRMYADDAVEIPSISAGQIGVIPGLKHVRTGDTVIVYTGANPKTGPPAPLNSLQLRPIAIPPPVFFTSVEPNSLGEEKNVSETLSLLLREDPSLNVNQDPESGQTHLAGMGELHLEIARDRLINDLKAKARTGSIQIGYREAVRSASSESEAVFDREVAGKASKAGCMAMVMPRDEAADIKDSSNVSIELSDNNVLIIRTPTLDTDGSALDPENASLPNSLPMQTLHSALENGVSSGLARGPLHGYPAHSTAVTIIFDPSLHLFSSTTPAALSAVARQAVTSALQDSSAKSDGTVLMEPVMLARITVDEASLGDVVHDISSARGGQVISLGSDDESDTSSSAAAADNDFPPIDPSRIWTPPDPFADSGAGMQMGMSGGTQMRTIVARVPLKEMVGYLKHLRSLTGGRGTFVMSVDRFERMSLYRMKAAMAELRGDFF